MGVWDPPKGWEKAGVLMRVDYHRKINVIAAKAGKKPYEVLDRLLGAHLKGKRIPDFEDLPE